MSWLQDRQSARIALPGTKIVASLVCLLGTAGSLWAQTGYQSTVRSRPADAPVEDSAADASVITDDRTPRTGESLPQLLSELPGVTISRLGGIGSLALVSLRGSTWDQVGVYVDGIPLNGAQGGGVDVSSIPLGDIERIEVYRGSSPIGFGSSALGGIISITTRSPRTTEGGVEVGDGSFGTWWASANASWAGRRLRVYVGVHVLSTDGDYLFSSDGGTAFDTSDDHQVRRTNNAVFQTDGTARVVLPIDGGRELSAFALVFLRNQGLPGYGSVRQTTETTLDNLRAIVGLAYDSKRDLGAGGRVRAQLYYTHESQQYRDPLGEISVAPAATNDRTRAIGGSVRLSRPVVSWLKAAAVAEVRYELFSPYDADTRPTIGAPATRTFGAAGLEADALWSRLRLHVIPSLRLEVARDVRSGRDGFSAQLDESAPITNVVPAARLALLDLVRDGVTLRANAARYSRLPSTMELYGDSGFILGNPNLVPESGWNADAGVNLRLGGRRFSVTADASFFASLVDDLIQFQQDAYGRARAINIGRARILGGEASVTAALSSYVRVVLDGTFLDARDVSDTSIGQHQPFLPNRPRLHFYARPEARWPINASLTVGAHVDVDLIDGNYLDPANLSVLPPRLFVGAGLFAEATRLHLVVVASGQNLNDARTFDFAGFPLPSRSFFVSARIHFNKETP